MKKLNLILSLLFFGFILNTSNAQEFLEFSVNDFKKISKQLDEKVELIILEEETDNKIDAEILLASFFTEENTHFTAIHKGRTKNEGFYQIGELLKGENKYRTYIYSKKIDDDYLIQEFRIEKE